MIQKLDRTWRLKIASHHNINIMSDKNAIYLVKQRWCHIGVLYNVSGGSGIPCSSQLQETQDSINLVESGSWMKVEVKWKWKLDRSGSWMEVEVRWKWKLKCDWATNIMQMHVM